MASKRHEMQSSDDIQKKSNLCILTVDVIVATMQGELVDGTPISTDIAELTLSIQNNLVSLLNMITGLIVFRSKRGLVHRLEDYINKTFDIIYVNEIPVIEAAGRLAEAEAVKATNFNALKNAAKKIENPFNLASPVAYETPYRYANICNDLLDAASYTLNNVNPSTGELYGLTDIEIRTKVKKVLQPFNYYASGWFPADIDDVPLMQSVHDSVIADIDTVDLAILQNRIDSQIPKLPLIRRNWAE